MSLHTMCCQLLSSTLFIFATFVLHLCKKVLIHVCLNLSIGLSQPSTFNTASCPSTSDEKKGEALIMPLIVHESCTDRSWKMSQLNSEIFSCTTAAYLIFRRSLARHSSNTCRLCLSRVWRHFFLTHFFAQVPCSWNKRVFLRFFVSALASSRPTTSCDDSASFDDSWQSENNRAEVSLRIMFCYVPNGELGYLYKLQCYNGSNMIVSSL